MLLQKAFAISSVVSHSKGDRLLRPWVFLDLLIGRAGFSYSYCVTENSGNIPFCQFCHVELGKKVAYQIWLFNSGRLARFYLAPSYGGGVVGHPDCVAHHRIPAIKARRFTNTGGLV